MMSSVARRILRLPIRSQHRCCPSLTVFLATWLFFTASPAVAAPLTTTYGDLIATVEPKVGTQVIRGGQPVLAIRAAGHTLAVGFAGGECLVQVDRGPLPTSPTLVSSHDLRTGELVGLEGVQAAIHAADVRDATVSLRGPNGEVHTVPVGCESGVVHDESAVPATLPTQGLWFTTEAVAVSPSGRFVAVSGVRAVAVWDMEHQRLLRSIGLYDDIVSQLAFDGEELVIVGAKSDRVWRYAPQQRAPIGFARLCGGARPTEVRLFADGRADVSCDGVEPRPGAAVTLERGRDYDPGPWSERHLGKSWTIAASATEILGLRNDEVRWRVPRATTLLRPRRHAAEAGSIGRLPDGRVVEPTEGGLRILADDTGKVLQEIRSPGTGSSQGWRLTATGALRDTGWGWTRVSLSDPWNDPSFPIPVTADVVGVQGDTVWVHHAPDARLQDIAVQSITLPGASALERMFGQLTPGLHRLDALGESTDYVPLPPDNVRQAHGLGDRVLLIGKTKLWVHHTSQPGSRWQPDAEIPIELRHVAANDDVAVVAGGRDVLLVRRDGDDVPRLEAPSTVMDLAVTNDRLFVGTAAHGVSVYELPSGEYVGHIPAAGGPLAISGNTLLAVSDPRLGMPRMEAWEIDTRQLTSVAPLRRRAWDECDTIDSRTLCVAGGELVAISDDGEHIRWHAIEGRSIVVELADGRWAAPPGTTHQAMDPATVPAVLAALDGKPAMPASPTSTGPRPHNPSASMDLPVGGTLHAVMVGVSRYDDEAWRLASAASDAARVYQWLVNSAVATGLPVDAEADLNLPAVLLGDMHAVSLTLLQDQEVRSSTLGKRLRQALSAVQPGDSVLVYFAGHGVRTPSGDYLFAPSDMDFDEPERRGFADEALRAILSELPSERQVLVMDTCNAGRTDPSTISRAKGVRVVPGTRGLGRSMSAPMDTRRDDLLAPFDPGGRTQLLAASGPMQFSFEESNGGLFTDVLLAELSALAIRPRGVRLSELGVAIGRTVSALTGGAQRSRLYLTGPQSDFVLFRPTVGP